MKPHDQLLESILAATPEDVEKLGHAAAAVVRSKLRAAKILDVMRHIFRHPELAASLDVAREFARGIEADFGVDTLDKIDERNLSETCSDTCHSHDFCDANVYMHRAILDVTGVDVADVPDATVRRLWEMAWTVAHAVGLHRLAAVRGCPDAPPEDLVVSRKSERALEVLLPGLQPDAYPLEVAVDFYGRNPRMQVMCFDHGDENGEPKVLVRYDEHGKVTEVVFEGEDIKVVTKRPGAPPTEWELTRDANPTCLPGDKLEMPSGLVADVQRLRDRYNGDIEQLKAYDASYGILARLGFSDAETAWEVNPLTAGTTNPEDFSSVPEPQPLY